MVLEQFNQALERHKADLDYLTYWRYRGGRLPKLLLWLVQRPQLAAALAADAAELAKVQKEEERG